MTWVVCGTENGKQLNALGCQYLFWIKYKTKKKTNRNGEIKMTENTNVIEAVEIPTEEVKPKRTRKAPVKIEKSAAQIVGEIEVLKAEVDKLAEAIDGLDGVAFDVINEAYQAKQVELEKALDFVYKA